MKGLIEPGTAEKTIFQRIPEAGATRKPLSGAAGRILRETVVADRPFPPFDRCMMDGYALRAADLEAGAVFAIGAEAPAGAPRRELGAEKGACVEMMTGAVLPRGADCVVPYEATERLDAGRMRVLDPGAHGAGDCVHPRASDRSEGEALLEPGRRMGAREIAVAATCGRADLLVSEWPAVAIVSTGDELVEIGATPAPHQIRRSNDRMIRAALEGAGFPVETGQHLGDEPGASTAALSELIETHDVILISGGISMGKRDYIPGALEAMGLSRHFGGVAQKPGKPLGFWTHPEATVFTLPGNPLSALTCVHHYVIPALRHAAGLVNAASPCRVRLQSAVRARDDLTVFLPVRRLPGNRAVATPANNSGDLVGILESDGYIELAPTEEGTYPAGESFDFHPWF